MNPPNGESDAGLIVLHVSDLHFHRYPRRLGHWLGKRGLGAANLLAGRARQHPLGRLRRLVARLDGLSWDHLVISGDLVQLSLETEFELAARELAPLLDRGPERVTIVPGNHDRYVRDSGADAAYARHFGRFFGGDVICTKPIGAADSGWWLAGWDSARPTPPFNATGALANGTLERTESWLRELPTGHRAIVVNHYPVLLPPNRRQGAHHGLAGEETVLRWLLEHNIAAYLHGHIHHNWTLEVPRPSTPDGAPQSPLTIVNSAASARTLRRGEHTTFHRLRLGPDRVDVEPLALEGDAG